MDDDDLDALVRRLENKLRAGWKAAIRRIKDETNLPELQRRIAMNDLGNLVEGIEDAIEQFTNELAQGYVNAGQKMARVIDGKTSRAFRFNLADEESVRWMRETAREIARPLVEEQQAVARRVVLQGRQRGLPARAIAEEVQGSIGLNSQQVDRVARYRQLLENGDLRIARAYELADGRYDRVLDRAMREGVPLGKDRIDAMVAKYRENWNRHRADVVALSEAQNATHAGIAEAVDQAIEGEFIDEENVRKRWVTRQDARVRHSHRSMHGQTRRFYEAFVSGQGNRLRYPGDPNAPASDTVNCRCLSVITFPDGRRAVERFGVRTFT